MLTSQQVQNLQTLHDLLPEQHHIGPVDPPQVGARYHCGQGRPCWLYNIATTKFAAQLAAHRDPRSRRRSRIIGLPIGPRLNPLVEYYGLNQEQIQTITEIDLQHIPDADCNGREVWLKRQQAHLQQVITRGSPQPAPPPAYVNHTEPVTTLHPVTQSETHQATEQPELASIST